MINNKETAFGMQKSYWLDSVEGTNYETLNDNINVDIAIVGGGITGITCAYLLQKEGFKVGLFEADKIINGTSGHTTAKITSQHSLIYTKIVNQMGIEMAKQYAFANESAKDFIKNTIFENNIDCDFLECPSYVYTENDNGIKKIEKEFNIVKGFNINSDLLSSIPLPLNIKAAVSFNNSAQFHPGKYLLYLASKIKDNGSKIYENTRITDIVEGKTCTLKTKSGKIITAERVIIASHYPFHDGFGFYFTRLLPSRSYVLAGTIKEDFPNGMFINCDNPVRSLRYQNYNEDKLILFGGDGHETGACEDTMKHYEALALFAQSKFTVNNFLYRWSAQDYYTPDNVPFAGYLTSKDNNIFAATGYGKWGMTNASAAAILIRDLIIERKNEWKDVYNPSRFTTAATKDFITLNFDIIKNLIKGKLKGGEKDIDLKNGEGKIIEIEGKKYGAYRDDNGKLHIVDSTCTHFGCELKWNDAEKTWDCPCHGSRFSACGEILEGPAFRNLNHYKEESNNIDPDIF